MTGISSIDFEQFAAVGLVLPLASLGLLGAGTEGAHAISLFGFASIDIEADLEQLLVRIAESNDDASRSREAITSAVVTAARSASGWISLRASDGSVAPVLALVGRHETCIAVLHGELVEWIFAADPLPVDLVRAFVAAARDNVAHMTVFAKGEAIAGARFHGEKVDVAAKEIGVLSRLTLGANRGLDSLCATVLAEL